MRKMASIVTISKITPIEGKDKIVVANFEENGYNVICSKDFSVGDKVVYCEVDSILPCGEKFACFEFLKPRCYKEKLGGYLIKNMKMGGIYSNGIIFKTTEVPIKKSIFSKEWKSGMDLTSQLEVRKYEPEDDASPVQGKKEGKIHKFIRQWMMKYSLTRPLARKMFLKKKIVGGSFPLEHISKSDEDNIMNNKGWYEKYKNVPCYVTRKIEGKSVTVINHPTNGLKVFGRNTALYAPAELAWCEKLCEVLKNVEKVTGHKYAIQGEFTGNGIQKNIYKINGYKFWVYKVVDITDGNKTLSKVCMDDFCDKYGLEQVPTVSCFKTLGETFKSLEEMQDYVEHQWFEVATMEDVDDREVSGLKKPQYHRHEGIVVRGMDNEFSFKCKSNEYQLAGL